jgi:two-component system chemotaxis response regulator CheB
MGGQKRPSCEPAGAEFANSWQTADSNEIAIMPISNSEKRDTIVLGASAGGIEALQRLLPAFSVAVEASVFVVVHLPADGNTVLDLILGRATGYRAAFATDGEVILPRRLYVAPPDQHLVISEGHVRLWRGARENRSRPAIDPLFRSAAIERRGRVIAGVLSGLLDDGAAGLLAVKRCGGLAFVQTPSDAVESEMPGRAAAALGEALDGALDAAALGARMAALVGTPAPSVEVPPDLRLEMDMHLGKVSGLDALSSGGPPSAISCPECGGPLWGIMEGRLHRFRCHTGHSYGVDSLLSDQHRQIEQALWAAIKGLEQRSQLLENLAHQVGAKRRPLAADNFESESLLLRSHAQTLRDILVASFRSTRS